MAEIVWEDLYRSLQILGPPPAPLVGVPTDDDLNRFESASGFRLPLTYRAFIKVFGPGQLALDFRLRGPGFRVARKGGPAQAFNEMVDLTAFNEALRHVRDNFRAMDGPYSQQSRRLIYLADNTAGDDVGWDPEDVRDPEAAEYGIYIVQREEGAARFLANSFSEFVMDTCVSDGLEQTLGGIQVRKPLDPEYMTFEPAWRTYEIRR